MEEKTGNKIQAESSQGVVKTSFYIRSNRSIGWYFMVFFIIEVIIYSIRNYEAFIISTIFSSICILHILTEKLVKSIDISQNSTKITFSQCFKDKVCIYDNDKIKIKRFSKVHFRVSDKIEVLQILFSNKVIAELDTLNGASIEDIQKIKELLKDKEDV